LLPKSLGHHPHRDDSQEDAHEPRTCPRRSFPGAAAVPLSVFKIRDDAAIEAPDHQAVEEPLEIRLAGMAFTVTMRTQGHDEDLVAGLLHAEGVIRSAESIDVIARYRGPHGEPAAGNVINVILKADLHVARERPRRSLVSSSACGVCGKVSIEAIRIASGPVISSGSSGTAASTSMREPIE
jgi:FdhD protein